MPDKFEKRFNENHQVRASEDGRKVGGYAAVFDSWTRIGPRFEERIAQGAFKNTLPNGDIRALWSHNTEKVIGRTRNGSLKLREDETGLAFDLDLPDTTEGRDAYTLIKGGYVTGVSFGFRVKKDSWERGDEGKPHRRTILDVELLEISPTPFPAYEQTHVAARSSDDVLKEHETEWAFEESERQKTVVKEPSIQELKDMLAFKNLRFNLV